MSSRPLPLFPPPGGDPWRLPHPAPTTLLALWPGSKPPLQEMVAEALIEHSPESVLVGELSSPPEGALWTLVVDVPAPIDARVILFAESAHPEGAADLDAACRDCRWVVGMELLLSPERPLRAFVAAMRMAQAITPGTPAILDVASSTWHGTGSLERWFAPVDADPPTWILWSAHAVCRDREQRPGHPSWIRSAGLWRCGLPELEILDLPTEHIPAGVALVHAVAELLLEAPPPAPGERWTIGQEIDVALVPWQAVVELLPPEVPGSLASRGLTPEASQAATLTHPLGGVRGVICGPEPRGTYRKLWSWPEAAIRRLAAGDALIQQSTLAVRRSKRMAQRHLPQLLEAVRLLSEAHALEAPSAGGVRQRHAVERGAPRVLVAAVFDPVVERFVESDDLRRADARDLEGPDGASASFDSPSPQAPKTKGEAHTEREPDGADVEDRLERRWIELRELSEEAVSGTIVVGSAAGEPAGSGRSATVSLGAITDWQVLVDGGALGPDEAEWLPEAVRRWLAATATERSPS